MKAILKMELAYKKMPIADAIVMLQGFADEGATHVTMRVRWEEPTAERHTEVAG
jgi:hypothetical protein